MSCHTAFSNSAVSLLAGAKPTWCPLPPDSPGPPAEAALSVRHCGRLPWPLGAAVGLPKTAHPLQGPGAPPPLCSTSTAAWTASLSCLTDARCWNDCKSSLVSLFKRWQSRKESKNIGIVQSCGGCVLCAVFMQQGVWRLCWRIRHRTLATLELQSLTSWIVMSWMGFVQLHAGRRGH